MQKKGYADFGHIFLSLTLFEAHLDWFMLVGHWWGWERAGRSNCVSSSPNLNTSSKTEKTENHGYTFFCVIEVQYPTCWPVPFSNCLLLASPQDSIILSQGFSSLLGKSSATKYILTLSHNHENKLHATRKKHLQADDRDPSAAMNVPTELDSPSLWVALQLQGRGRGEAGLSSVAETSGAQSAEAKRPSQAQEAWIRRKGRKSTTEGVGVAGSPHKMSNGWEKLGDKNTFLNRKAPN